METIEIRDTINIDTKVTWSPPVEVEKHPSEVVSAIGIIGRFMHAQGFDKVTIEIAEVTKGTTET